MKLTRKDVGYLTVEQVKAIDPAFYTDVQAAIAHPTYFAYKPSDGSEPLYLDEDVKVGSLLLHYNPSAQERYGPGTAVSDRDDGPRPGFMLVRVTSVKPGFDGNTVRVSNGDWTWRGDGCGDFKRLPA